MARRKRRIDRKLHKRFIFGGIQDLSMYQPWRQLLKAAPLYNSFLIDVHHLESVNAFTAKGIRRYGLSYRVYRVPQRESGWDRWEYNDEHYVYFRFEAVRHPDIYAITANNPEF